jgi:hypothetical protein
MTAFALRPGLPYRAVNPTANKASAVFDWP